MKRSWPICVIALCFCLSAGAQRYTDSLTVILPSVDSSIAGADVFALLRESGNAEVTVYQSSAIRDAFNAYKAANALSSITGYRIRVYYDNVRSSRTDSEEVAKSLCRIYPWLPVYRTYESPYFRVAVGDFRTPDEAMKLFNELKVRYPMAFIVKETINYPVQEPEVSDDRL